MTFCPQQKVDVNLDHYKCSYYERVGKTCSGSHYLRKEILEELILDDFNQIISTLELSEESLLEKTEG